MAVRLEHARFYLSDKQLGPIRPARARRASGCVDRAVGRLMMDDARLAELAIDCGFSDQSHLTRDFVREVGLPPGTALREWRDLGARR